ncbi:MAG: hypothetical protein Q7S33_00115 [Nanoarchaeota archaeon]|nr:hypothetical protein [Nanoarchaeota archaeon]
MNNLNSLNLSEKVLEALTSLILINEKYSHKYYCNAENIHQHYLLDLKPVLEQYKGQSDTISRQMEKREEIYQEQVSCRDNSK